MPAHVLLLAFLLSLASSHAPPKPNEARQPPTCATLALTRALDSSSCSEITSTEADIATQHALHCLLTHVGGSPPPCLLGTQASSCLSSVGPDTYEAFRALRSRWASLCAAAAAQRVVQSLREAVETGRAAGRRGRAGAEAGGTLRKAREAAVGVLEANLELLAEAPGLRRAAGEARKVKEVVRREKVGREERREEVREAVRGAEEAVRGVKEAVDRVRAAGERVGEGVDMAVVAGFGDGGLVGCAVIRGGRRGWVVAVGVGMVTGMRAGSGLVVGAARERVDMVVWGVRLVLVVVCLGWLMRADGEVEGDGESWGGGFRRSESVEETSPVFDDDDSDENVGEEDDEDKEDQGGKDE